MPSVRLAKGGFPLGLQDFQLMPSVRLAGGGFPSGLQDFQVSRLEHQISREVHILLFSRRQKEIKQELDLDVLCELFLDRKTSNRANKLTLVFGRCLYHSKRRWLSGTFGRPLGDFHRVYRQRRQRHSYNEKISRCLHIFCTLMVGRYVIETSHNNLFFTLFQ